MTGPAGARSAAGTAVAIESLHEDAQRLDPEAFEARHGSAFLLVSAASVGGRSSSSATEMLLGLESDDPSANTATVAVVVYPLRQRSESKGHLVTIGRDPKHDVVIPDPTVSRFHAFGKLEEGTFVIHDEGSSNGTTVNGAFVPGRGMGPPTQLKPGDTVKLGQVETTFTDAKALRDFALKMGG
jgi:hypothetical protein